MTEQRHCEAQIEPARYLTESYFSREQWASVRAQVDAVRRLEDVHRVLEVGPGNVFTSAILKKCGFEVVTVDINASLCPCSGQCNRDVRALPKGAV